MSHEDPFRPDSGRDRGAYTPPTDDDLPFRRGGAEPRRMGGAGAKAPPMTLTISAAVLVLLIIAVVVYYRAGPRSSEDAPPAIGTPVTEMKGPAPIEAQPIDPEAGIQVYSQADTTDTVPTLAPPPEVVLPRPAPKADVVTTPPPVVKAEAPKAATPPSAGGTAGVQIGAFSTPNLAEREYAAVVGRYRALTEGASRRVQEVTTSAGATVYRTTVTGLSPAQARELCAAIKAAGDDCIVR